VAVIGAIGLSALVLLPLLPLRPSIPETPESGALPGDGLQAQPAVPIGGRTPGSWRSSDSPQTRRRSGSCHCWPAWPPPTSQASLLCRLSGSADPVLNLSHPLPRQCQGLSQYLYLYLYLYQHKCQSLLQSPRKLRPGRRRRLP